MTIQEAMAYIHTPRGRGAAPGLSRIQQLLAAMGDPQRELRFVHIAGTNGKGSAAAMVAAMLQAAGYTVGLFTSPFIFTFGERIQVNGVPIGDGDLAQLVEEVRPPVEAMAQPPTEFELVTALAMAHFRRCRCHVVVLEAGLGGALDATNVIASPLAAVLTNIGLDHTEILGTTLAEIARAKCGIIKAGTVAVTYPGQPPVEGEIARGSAPLGGGPGGADLLLEEYGKSTPAPAGGPPAVQRRRGPDRGGGPGGAGLPRPGGGCAGGTGLGVLALPVPGGGPGPGVHCGRRP